MAFLRGSLRATIGFGGAFSPVFLHLLGSSSSPLLSRPRFLPLDLPTFSQLILGLSPPCALTCGLLPGRFGPICQFWTFIIGGVFVPVDFRHWDLLSMLFLEIGDEFSHLVGTPTSLCKSLLQSSHQAVVDEKGGESFSGSDVGWAHWQGEVNLLLHMRFGASAPSASCGAFSSGASSEEYSSTTFLSALPPDIGFFFRLAFPLPIANGLPPVFSRTVCLVRAMQRK